MAGSVNKVIIIGNLGADPDVRTTPTGQMVATLSVATSETFNNREGQRQERTEWHRVVLWGKLAELAQRYLSKGRKVYLEGRIQTRSWDDQQTGQKRYSTEVVANQMVFIDSGGGGGAREGAGGEDYSGGGGAGGGSGGGYQRSQPQRQSTPPRAGGGGGGGNRPATDQGPPPTQGDDPGYFDDDVPF
jgi:single-strand DNA-binding protein